MFSKASKITTSDLRPVLSKIIGRRLQSSHDSGANFVCEAGLYKPVSFITISLQIAGFRTIPFVKLMEAKWLLPKKQAH